MNNHIEVLKLALEALEWMVANDDTNEGDEPLERLGGQSWNEYNAYWIDGLNKARASITAIKQAITEPVHQKPLFADIIAQHPGLAEELKAMDIAPVQEPVAWVTGWHAGRCVIQTVNPAAILPVGIALYTTPPTAQRQWTGLTDEDYNTNMFSITSLGACDIATIKSIAKDVEVKLKEKNT